MTQHQPPVLRLAWCTRHVESLITYRPWPSWYQVSLATRTLSALSRFGSKCFLASGTRCGRRGKKAKKKSQPPTGMGPNNETPKLSQLTYSKTRSPSKKKNTKAHKHTSTLPLQKSRWFWTGQATMSLPQNLWRNKINTPAIRTWIQGHPDLPSLNTQRHANTAHCGDNWHHRQRWVQCWVYCSNMCYTAWVSI
jgi:hypothetical protein